MQQILTNINSIENFWIKLLIFLVCFYIIQIIFDYILWVTSARQKQQLSSKVNISWTFMKWLILLFILTITIFIFWISLILSLDWNTYLMFTLIPSIFMTLFCLWEFTSMIENLSVIFTNKKSWAIFKVLNYISEKIFNLTLDKLKEKTEQKIENKINNI